MIFKIVGYIWGGIGMIGWISSCSTMFGSCRPGGAEANYGNTETFLIRLIIFFFLFILPGLILIRMGRKTL